MQSNNYTILFFCHFLGDSERSELSNLTACFDNTKPCSSYPKVFLLPSVLAQKRMWNPKYPICIQLSEGSSSLEKEARSEEDSAGEEPLNQRPSKPTTLYLFGRTGREKEEWFRHLQLASVEAQVETDVDKHRAGRCVGRSGMRRVIALVKRRLLEKASLQMYVWIMDYMLQFLACQSPLSENSGLIVFRFSENRLGLHLLLFPYTLYFLVFSLCISTGVGLCFDNTILCLNGYGIQIPLEPRNWTKTSLRNCFIFFEF